MIKTTPKQSLCLTKKKEVIKEIKITSFDKQKKLASLEKMLGMFSGLIPEHVDTQWIKAQN